jgi:hypothetical protein
MHALLGLCHTVTVREQQQLLLKQGIPWLQVSLQPWLQVFTCFFVSNYVQVVAGVYVHLRLLRRVRLQRG